MSFKGFFDCFGKLLHHHIFGAHCLHASVRGCRNSTLLVCVQALKTKQAFSLPCMRGFVSGPLCRNTKQSSSGLRDCTVASSIRKPEGHRLFASGCKPYSKEQLYISGGRLLNWTQEVPHIYNSRNLSGACR